MNGPYLIASARAADVPLIPAIERAAATLLCGHAPESALSETTSVDVLDDARGDGRLWVALAGDEPVGYALVRPLGDDCAHLEEIDVHPDHGRRGLGRRLVAEVCAWAAALGYPSVTLTTFRNVPFNMPFYARLGFEEVVPDRLPQALRSIVADEATRGLDPAARVVMRMTLAKACASSRRSVRR